MSRDVKFIKDVFPFATPEDVHIESHGFMLPYDIHDDFVEYEEYIEMWCMMCTMVTVRI